VRLVKLIFQAIPGTLQRKNGTGPQRKQHPDNIQAALHVFDSWRIPFGRVRLLLVEQPFYIARSNTGEILPANPSSLHIDARYFEATAEIHSPMVPPHHRAATNPLLLTD